MRRFGFLVLVVCLTGFPALAGSVEIELSDGAPPIHAFIYKPSAKGKYPGVFVLHHSAGFTGSVKEFSSRLSEKGFVTMAVDFEHRGWFDAHFAAAYDYLRKLPAVDGNRIGFVGFSRGARLGMVLATNWKTTSPPRPFRAFISYYIGNEIEVMPTTDLPPILFLHGANDPEVKADLITVFCEMQNQMGGACEAKIYEGASHAFDRDTFYGPYDHQATVDALERSGNFLDKYLKGAPVQ